MKTRNDVGMFKICFNAQDWDNINLYGNASLKNRNSLRSSSLHKLLNVYFILICYYYTNCKYIVFELNYFHAPLIYWNTGTGLSRDRINIFINSIDTHD